MQLPSGLVVEKNVQLKNLTSWLVGGAAEFFAQPTSIDQLREASAWGVSRSLPMTVISGGTNVLVSDVGIKGLVIALAKLNSVSVKTNEQAGANRLEIECFAGTSKSELLKIFLKAKLEPALFLAGLPGDVGGGVAMNAGVGESLMPREFNELTDWIEVLKPDGTMRRYLRSELQWSYRHCQGWRPGIISRVGLSWPLALPNASPNARPEAPSVDILDRVRAANKTRLTKQPLDQPSCGSVFMNPPGHKSGQLIENAGLKGFAIGGAQVSKKHANFIVNTGAATALDIHSVIKHVQQTVLEKYSVHLKTEVVYLGEWSDCSAAESPSF